MLLLGAVIARSEPTKQSRLVATEVFLDCIDALAMTRIKLTPACAYAAIDRIDHTRRIPRVIRRQERHEVADLARMRRTAERQALLEFLVAALVAELVLGPRLQQRDVAVGADRTGINADHADVVGEALAAERAGEGHQRGIAGAAADVVGVKLFA